MKAGLIDLQLWQIIFTIGNVLILAWFLKRFLFVPVKTMMDKRTSEIAATIAEADQKNAEAEQILASYQSKIAEAQSESRDIIQKAQGTAEKRAEEILADAKAESQKIKERAYKDIELEKDKAFRSIKGEVAEIAVLATEKLLGKTIDKDTNQSLIDAVIGEIGDETWSS